MSSVSELTRSRLDRLRAFALAIGGAGGLVGFAVGLTASRADMTAQAVFTIPAASYWAFIAIIAAGIGLAYPAAAAIGLVVAAAGMLLSLDVDLLTLIAGGLMLAGAVAFTLAGKPTTVPRVRVAFEQAGISPTVPLAIGALGVLFAIAGGFGPYFEDDIGKLWQLLALPFVGLVGAGLVAVAGIAGAVFMIAAAIAIGVLFEMNALTIVAIAALAMASAIAVYGSVRRAQITPAAMDRPIVPSVILIMWKRELLRFSRDRSQIFGAFSRTILWLLVLGYGLGVALREIEGYPYSHYVLPGVVVLNVLYASLQSSIALVWDKNVGLLREVLVSPAPTLSVTLGKLFGGATVATIQGSVPLLFMPIIGLGIAPVQILMAWGVMFILGVFVTSIGVIIASRMRTFEGFGAISNGVIQPLYFLSGSIFPLRGAIGGTGFTQLPNSVREELRRYGVRFAAGSWFVQLPVWLRVLVFANPITYNLDLLRYIILTPHFNQLPLYIDYLVTFLLPLPAIIIAAFAMRRMLRPR